MDEVILASLHTCISPGSVRMAPGFQHVGVLPTKQPHTPTGLILRRMLKLSVACNAWVQHAINMCIAQQETACACTGGALAHMPKTVSVDHTHLMRLLELILHDTARVRCAFETP